MVRAVRQSYLLQQMIRKPTRVSGTASTLIDHVYTNNPDKVNMSGSISYGISDHHLVYISLKKNIEKKSKISFSCRKLGNYSFQQLENNLLLPNWDSFFNNQDPLDCWNTLLTVYTASLDLLAPMITITNVKETDNWVTAELISLIRHRDQLKSELDLCSTTEGYNSKVKEFRKIRNHVKRGVITAKRNYTLNKLRSNEDNPRKYWVDLNKIMPTGKNSNKSKDKKDVVCLKDENDILVDTKITSKFINEFFTNIGPNLASKISDDNATYLSDIENHEPENSMSEWRHTDFVEVTSLIKDIDIYKNSNIDNINGSLFKDCLLASVRQITYLFNLIFKTGIFPDAWKLATVIPLFKSGSESPPSLVIMIESEHPGCIDISQTREH